MTDVLDDSFDQIVTDHMRDACIPGVSLVVQHEGKTTYKSSGKAFGDEPVTSKTRFPLCSLTKHVIALALLRALGENGLSTDTPVSQVLPHFKAQSGPVTFAHILSHTTGLEPSAAIWSDIIDNKQDYYDYFATLPCLSTPGEKFFYATCLYDLCVPAIETLSGESVEDYLRRIFFDPLGMANTSYTGRGGADSAMGHTGKSIPVPFGPGIGSQGLDSYIAWKGCGGLISCVEDMVKWTRYLPSDRFFPDLIQSRIPAHDPIRPGRSIHDSGEQYGLGMLIGTYLGIRYYEHWGAMAGFAGLMTILPELNLSVVSFSNSWEGRELGSMIVATIVNRLKGWDGNEALKLLKKEFNHRRNLECSDFSSIHGSIDKPIVGIFHGQGIGRLVFTNSSNVTVRPQCEPLPWLCWMFGPVKPIVTYVGNGKYAGCLQMEFAGKVRYGYPFRCEKRDGGIWMGEFHLSGPFMMLPEEDSTTPSS